MSKDEVVIEYKPEVTIKLAKKGFIFYEVGISYHGRNYDQGK